MARQLIFTALLLMPFGLFAQTAFDDHIGIAAEKSVDIVDFWRDRVNGTWPDGNDYKRSRCVFEGATPGNFTACNGFNDEAEAYYALLALGVSGHTRYSATLGNYPIWLLRGSNAQNKLGLTWNHYRSNYAEADGLVNDTVDAAHQYEPQSALMRGLQRFGGWNNSTPMSSDTLLHIFGESQIWRLVSPPDDLLPPLATVGARGLMFTSPRGGLAPQDRWPQHDGPLPQPQMAMEKMATIMTTFGMFNGVGAAHPLWSDTPGPNNSNLLYQLYATWMSALDVDDSANSGKPPGWLPAKILADGSFGDDWCLNEAHAVNQNGGWAKGLQYGIPYVLHGAAILQTGNATQKALARKGFEQIQAMYCVRQAGGTMPSCGSILPYDHLYLDYVALRPEDMRLEDVANGCDAGLFARSKNAVVTTSKYIAYWQAEMAKDPASRNFAQVKSSMERAAQYAHDDFVANETAWTTGAVGNTESIKPEDTGEAWGYMRTGLVGGYDEGLGAPIAPVIVRDPDIKTTAVSMMYAGREYDPDNNVDKLYWRYSSRQASPRNVEFFFTNVVQPYGLTPGLYRIRFCHDVDWDFECEAVTLTYNDIPSTPGTTRTVLGHNALGVEGMMYLELRTPQPHDPTSTPDFGVLWGETSWSPDFTAQTDAERKGTVKARIRNVGLVSGQATVQLVDDNEAPLAGIPSKTVRVDPLSDRSGKGYTLVVFNDVPQGQINVKVSGNGDRNAGNNIATVFNQ